MHDIPLNDTQRIFADKNHNLVYKFLHEKNLPASEYYDIVIFGYLTRHSTPTVTDEEALRESEVALLLHALAKRVTPQQMEIIRLRTKGYQTNEIAQMQNTSLYHVNTLLDNARFIVVELCRDA